MTKMSEVRCKQLSKSVLECVDNRWKVRLAQKYDRTGQDRNNNRIGMQQFILIGNRRLQSAVYEQMEGKY